MASNRATSRSGFTLVELLVVLAVIAIFVGVFATALRPGSPTVAVQGGQSQVASLLTQARGVAVLKGAPTRLIIHADPDNRDRFLRFAGIVWWNENLSPPGWDEATDGITLPNGVYFVPPVENPPPDISIEYLGDWNNDVNSIFSQASSIDQIRYVSTEEQDYYYIDFTERGLVNTLADPPILALSTAQPRPDTNSLQFDNEGVTRGAILRQYGSFILLNQPAEFP